MSFNSIRITPYIGVVCIARMVPGNVDGMPGLAVGPWHVKAHVPACQEKYGARRMLMAGNSFGDNIEHAWAHYRKFAHILKRMATATREDYMTDLVRSSSTAMWCFVAGKWCYSPLSHLNLGRSKRKWLYLHMQAEAWQRRKERGLAQQLLRWHKTAARLHESLKLSIGVLQREIAQLQSTQLQVKLLLLAFESFELTSRTSSRLLV